MLISNQILVHVTVIFRNLIYVCITIKDKPIKHLHNSHLRKLPIAQGEVSIMNVKCENSFLCPFPINACDSCETKSIYLYIYFFIWVLRPVKINSIILSRVGR